VGNINTLRYVLSMLSPQLPMRDVASSSEAVVSPKVRGLLTDLIEPRRSLQQP
jgi:hypothetical protein